MGPFCTPRYFPRLGSMQEIYNANAIEREIQNKWVELDAYKTDESSSRPKYYCVSMLPYPSGKLHMGHVRNYAICDVMARHRRMQGFNVLMPMGWDAFGMPAENAAIAHGVSPAKWTRENISCMRNQLKVLGFAFDWSRELATCNPEYYKWSQWFFLKMLEKGIAYKKTGVVNWDPIEQTVLANEQVIDGCGWRSGAPIVKREIPMYYLRITDYARELERDLDKLGWPERVKLMQRNWIGKSTGIVIKFLYELNKEEFELKVFSTRPDTLMGVTFVVIAPQHPLAMFLAQDRKDLAEFIAQCQLGSVAEADLATAEKIGINTGLFVRHPINHKMLPLWIGNYVLMNYGEGAVMAVPAHDERDFVFAKKYSLPIVPVISLPNQKFSDKEWDKSYTEEKKGFLINSGKFDGLSSVEAKEKIVEELASLGVGEEKTIYRLRDWGISRQRYWGTPIPIIICDHCGDVPVPESDLPVILPEGLVPDKFGSPLTRYKDFVETICPSCGRNARRETDTMDTFVDSSWYFLKYTCPNATTMVDSRADYWMPMDCYVGGIEHAILHLLYSRFWTKVMHDFGLLKEREPALNLLTQGMVLNNAYYRIDENGKKTWLSIDDVKMAKSVHSSNGLMKSEQDGNVIYTSGVEKMSKSKSNGVDPQKLIDRFGADTARFFMIFAAPPEQQLEWSESGVEGASRFLKKLWHFAYKNKSLLLHAQKSAGSDLLCSQTEEKIISDLRRDIHALLKQVSYDYERNHYNTVASSAMKMLNACEIASNLIASVNEPNYLYSSALREAYRILLCILYPIVPHITCKLWEVLGYEDAYSSLLDTCWPKVDESALNQQTLQMILQINGKFRGKLTIAATASVEEIEKIARESTQVKRYSNGKTIRKTIVVPGKLVNIVL